MIKIHSQIRLPFRTFVSTEIQFLWKSHKLPDIVLLSWIWNQVITPGAHVERVKPSPSVTIHI